MFDRRKSSARGLRALLVLACAACVLIPAEVTCAASVLPDDGFAPGWLKSGPGLRFNDKNLFDYIDGGAELFLEFGFKELLVQRYAHGGSELTLEVYRMESPEAALGIYLARSDAETPVDGIKTRNTGSPHQVSVLKGSAFVQINNFEGGEESLPVMAELANRALDRVPPGKPVTLLRNLPRENLVPGSEALVRGPFGLQPIFTFGNGDPLLLGGRVFAVVGDYYEDGGREERGGTPNGRTEARPDTPTAAAGPDAATYTRIVVVYPGRSAASRAYAHLLANLDTYIEVLRKSAPDSGAQGSGAVSSGGERSGATAASGAHSSTPGFVFKDYRARFGSVELRGRVMDISVNLSKEP
jgi:hypothetical protein